EIRRSGGIVAVGRREFSQGIGRERVIEFPDQALARTMTSTEQIVWAHRVDKERRELKPGDTLRVYADLLPASDGTAPFAIHTFNAITDRLRASRYGESAGALAPAGPAPQHAAIANDHFVFTG